MRHPARRRPSLAAFTAFVSFAALVPSACSDDGRELRPPSKPLPIPTSLAPTTLPLIDAQPISPVTIPQGLRLLAPWQNDATIPLRYTCDGDDFAPPLTWTGLPDGTVEVALTMTDVDADFIHWVMTGLEPTRSGLVEDEVPEGARQWTNDFGVEGWGGPCPPANDPPHRYLFAVYALNQRVEAADDLGATELVSLLNQRSIAQSAVSGRYARAG